MNYDILEDYQKKYKITDDSALDAEDIMVTAQHTRLYSYKNGPNTVQHKFLLPSFGTIAETTTSIVRDTFNTSMGVCFKNMKRVSGVRYVGLVTDVKDDGGLAFKIIHNDSATRNINSNNNSHLNSSMSLSTEVNKPTGTSFANFPVGDGNGTMIYEDTHETWDEVLTLQNNGAVSTNTSYILSKQYTSSNTSSNFILLNNWQDVLTSYSNNYQASYIDINVAAASGIAINNQKIGTTANNATNWDIKFFAGLGDSTATTTYQIKTDCYLPYKNYPFYWCHYVADPLEDILVQIKEGLASELYHGTDLRIGYTDERWYSYYNADGSTNRYFAVGETLLSDSQYFGADANINGRLTPFNLVMTTDESQAMDYLSTGTLPDDAFCFYFKNAADPTQWDTQSKHEEYKNDYQTDDNDDSDDSERSDERPRTTPSTMSANAATLSNNNYYWLTATQFSDFIRWFWDDVGDMNDFSDFINIVQGLYENLEQSIVGVRFYPVSSSYLSLSTVTKINLSRIARGGVSVSAINKTVQHRVLLGSIMIKEKTKNFLDYHPYTKLSLYLPLYGFIDLDTNFFMGYRLKVFCVYNPIDGTLQYEIFCGDTLADTVVADMGINIDLSLSSAREQNSAMMRNITGMASGVASLAGAAAATAATGGAAAPMLAGSATSALSSMSNMSAPSIQKFGKSAGNGKYEITARCALYRINTTYNRPSTYGKTYGFPCYKSYKLSELSGFTRVENPTLTFSGDSKPLKHEVEKLYSLLKEGVRL